jgi:hypothetical protein
VIHFCWRNLSGKNRRKERVDKVNEKVLSKKTNMAVCSLFKCPVIFLLLIASSLLNVGLAGK